MRGNICPSAGGRRFLYILLSCFLGRSQFGGVLYSPSLWRKWGHSIRHITGRGSDVCVTYRRISAAISDTLGKTYAPQVLKNVFYALLMGVSVALLNRATTQELLY